MPAETQESSVGVLRVLVATAGILFCHFVALVVLIVVLVSDIAHFQAVCKEYALTLPAATQFTIQLSEWMIGYWYLAVLGLGVDGVVYFLLARLRAPLNWCASLWAFAPLVFTIVLLGLVTTGVCVPLRQMLADQQGTVAAPPR